MVALVAIILPWCPASLGGGAPALSVVPRYLGTYVLCMYITIVMQSYADGCIEGNRKYGLPRLYVLDSLLSTLP